MATLGMFLRSQMCLMDLNLPRDIIFKFVLCKFKKPDLVPNVNEIH